LDLAKWSQQGLSSSNAVADGFSKAVEFVVTPGLFGAGGYFLDRWLGTSPVFMAVLFLWALAVTVAMAIRDYGARMRAEEERILGPRPGSNS
jgi:F0F1-type ATP synthase assembly protein I